MRRFLLVLLCFILGSGSSAFAQLQVDWLNDTLPVKMVIRSLPAGHSMDLFFRMAEPDLMCKATGFFTNSIITRTNYNTRFTQVGDTLTLQTYQSDRYPSSWIDIRLTSYDTITLDGTFYEYPHRVYFKRRGGAFTHTYRLTPTIIEMGDPVLFDVAGATDASDSPNERIMLFKDTADRGKTASPLQAAGAQYNASYASWQFEKTGRKSGIFQDGVVNFARPGVYDILMTTGSDQCEFIEAGLIVKPRSQATGRGYLRGSVYVDKSRNCLKDTADRPAAYAVVRALNTVTQQVYVGLAQPADGSYEIRVPAGSYRVELVSRKGAAARACVPSRAVMVDSAYAVVQGIDFLDSARAADIEVALSDALARPGRKAIVSVTSYLNGDTPLQSRIVLELDTAVAYVPNPLYTPSIDSVVGNTIYFKANGGLADMNTRVNRVMFLPRASGSLIGRQLHFRVRRLGPADADPTNDTASRWITVRGGYDPNDKQVTPTSLPPGSDGFLSYTVRFQNTGTDTAFYVVVRDTLSPLLDLSTIRSFASTHSARYALKDRVLEARFPFINLVDSNRNEPASHGQFSFKVKPVAGLALGQEIENKADIYFDYNAPVRTNTATFRVQQPTALVAAKQEVLQWVPNPAAEIVRLPMTSVPKGRLLATDAAGQMHVLRYIYSDGVVSADLKTLAQGVYQLRFEHGVAACRVAVVR